MYGMNDSDLEKLGALITTREIQQQPKLWQEAYDNYLDQKEVIATFLREIESEYKGSVRVIFTGAGSSAYVGNTITPYLTENGNNHFTFEAIDTTKIVSTPKQYLKPNQPTLLVSFARSGNSPESVATVDIAEKYIKHLYQMTITCAPKGKLAQHAKHDLHNLVLMQPAKSNDKGFAMTGSFSCMLLTALLVFDRHSDLEKGQFVKNMAKMGQNVIDREAELQKIVDIDFERIVYLGSGTLGGLTQEAQLKVLELTAGQKAAMFDTSMGFRHGPKSFVNDKTLVFDFLSNENYTRQYDVDILNEVAGDEIAPIVMGIGVHQTMDYTGSGFYFDRGERALPDAYLALPDVMFAQTIALLASIKVGNTPDTPSHSGTVNRVVKGVIIHDFKG